MAQSSKFIYAHPTSYIFLLPLIHDQMHANYQNLFDLIHQIQISINQIHLHHPLCHQISEWVQTPTQILSLISWSMTQLGTQTWWARLGLRFRHGTRAWWTRLGLRLGLPLRPAGLDSDLDSDSNLEDLTLTRTRTHTWTQTQVWWTQTPLEWTHFNTAINKPMKVITYNCYSFGIGYICRITINFHN